jgi:hypothetical protein
MTALRVAKGGVEIKPHQVAGIRAIVTRPRCQQAVPIRARGGGFPARNAGNQLLQRVAASTPFRLSDLDNEFAVTHLHSGGLADAGANLLRERSARLLPHFKNATFMQWLPFSIYNVL